MLRRKRNFVGQILIFGARNLILLDVTPSETWPTVRDEIVVSRQNFVVRRDWMKTCHVVQTPGIDCMIPLPTFVGETTILPRIDNKIKSNNNVTNNPGTIM